MNSLKVAAVLISLPLITYRVIAILGGLLLITYRGNKAPQ